MRGRLLSMINFDAMPIGIHRSFTLVSSCRWYESFAETRIKQADAAQFRHQSREPQGGINSYIPKCWHQVPLITTRASSGPPNTQSLQTDTHICMTAKASSRSASRETRNRATNSSPIKAGNTRIHGCGYVGRTVTYTQCVFVRMKNPIPNESIEKLN